MMDKKRKTVLVLTTSFPVYAGIAVGIHVLEKCRQLVKHGWDVQVIAPSHFKSKKHEIIDGIRVTRFSYFIPHKIQKLAYGSGIPTNYKKHLIAKIQLPFFLFAFLISALRHAKNADIIHCHWSIAGIIGSIVGKILNKKVVLMMHGAEVFVLGNCLLLKFILKHCDYLISNSSFTEEKTLAVYPVKNHSIIPPGVNLNRFFSQYKVDNLRKKLNIPDGGLLILTIGKFIPRKGIEYLIKAMDILVNTRKQNHLYLRIGGRGPLQVKYEEMIKKLNLTANIEFIGYIPDEYIPSYYTSADIFVLPSIIDDSGDTEGLGVVLLEANACGTPVIGSSVGGIKDVINDGENGYFTKQKSEKSIANKLQILINDKNQRKKMGATGRERISKEFNWDSLTKKIIKIYNGL